MLDWGIVPPWGFSLAWEVERLGSQSCEYIKLASSILQSSSESKPIWRLIPTHSKVKPFNVEPRGPKQKASTVCLRRLFHTPNPTSTIYAKYMFQRSTLSAFNPFYHMLVYVPA
jgi:hypothetical protein